MALVGLIAVLQLATELVVGRNYGVAMLFITPSALLMGQIVAPAPSGGLILDRGVETVVGGIVGIAVLAAAHLLGLRSRRVEA